MFIIIIPIYAQISGLNLYLKNSVTLECQYTTFRQFTVVLAKVVKF